MVCDEEGGAARLVSDGATPGPTRRTWVLKEPKTYDIFLIYLGTFNFQNLIFVEDKKPYEFYFFLNVGWRIERYLCQYTFKFWAQGYLAGGAGTYFVPARRHIIRPTGMPHFLLLQIHFPLNFYKIIEHSFICIIYFYSIIWTICSIHLFIFGLRKLSSKVYKIVIKCVHPELAWFGSVRRGAPSRGLAPLHTITNYNNNLAKNQGIQP